MVPCTCLNTSSKEDTETFPTSMYLITISLATFTASSSSGFIGLPFQEAPAGGRRHFFRAAEASACRKNPSEPSLPLALPECGMGRQEDKTSADYADFTDCFLPMRRGTAEKILFPNAEPCPDATPAGRSGHCIKQRRFCEGIVKGVSLLIEESQELRRTITRLVLWAL